MLWTQKLLPNIPLQQYRYLISPYYYAKIDKQQMNASMPSAVFIQKRKPIMNQETASYKHLIQYFSQTTSSNIKGAGNLVLFKNDPPRASSSQHVAIPTMIGALGVIPFIAPPMVMYSQAITCQELVDANLCYGAIILSFLGGIRWGMAANPGVTVTGSLKQYSWSVIPPLIAWSGLLMLPGTSLGYITIIGGLVLTCYKDVGEKGYTTWFKGLRLLLTFVSVLSMTCTLAITFLYPTKKELTQTLNTAQNQLAEIIKSSKNDTKSNVEDEKVKENLSGK